MLPTANDIIWMAFISLMKALGWIASQLSWWMWLAIAFVALRLYLWFIDRMDREVHCPRGCPRSSSSLSGFFKRFRRCR